MGEELVKSLMMWFETVRAREILLISLQHKKKYVWFENLKIGKARVPCQRLMMRGAGFGLKSVHCIR